MSVRRSDAQQAETKGNGDSSPEMLPTGHQSRLAIPRDWRSTINRRKSENPRESVNSSSRKEQRQAQLENDGEWYADARGSPVSNAEKVQIQSSCSRCFFLISPVTGVRIPNARHVGRAAHSLMSLCCSEGDSIRNSLASWPRVFLSGILRRPQQAAGNYVTPPTSYKIPQSSNQRYPASTTGPSRWA